jgi:hypothetical protein
MSAATAPSPAEAELSDTPAPPSPRGLSSDQARQRIRQSGWNEPASERGHAFFFQCVSLLTNPISSHSARSEPGFFSAIIFRILSIELLAAPPLLVEAFDHGVASKKK